jgi:hypothetical protein
LALALLTPEIPMQARKFDAPVAIFVGLGFPREVETVFDAFKVLNEWPASGRGPDHDAALEACRAALTSSASAALARQSFEAFARGRDILAPDAMAAAARDFARQWMSA